MSISYTVDDSYVQIFKESLKSRKKYLHVHFTPERQLSQFQHYERLSQLLSNEVDDHWVAFTDDDDLWAPNRIETMISACDDADLETQCIRFKSLTNPRSFEYVDYAVRFSYYREFFCRAHSLILESKFCDLVFRNFMYNCRNAETHKSPNELYYYYLPAHTYNVIDDSIDTAVCVHSDTIPLDRLEHYAQWRGLPFLLGRNAGDKPLHHIIHAFYRALQYENLSFSHALWSENTKATRQDLKDNQETRIVLHKRRLCSAIG